MGHCSGWGTEVTAWGGGGGSSLEAAGGPAVGPRDFEQVPPRGSPWCPQCVFKGVSVQTVRYCFTILGSGHAQVTLSLSFLVPR